MGQTHLRVPPSSIEGSALTNSTPADQPRRLPQPSGYILAAVAGVLGAVLLGAGIYLSYSKYQGERDRVLLDVAGQAQVVGARFDQFFRERFEYLDALAQSPLVQTGAPAEVKAYFERIAGRGSTFSGGLSLIGTDGQLILLSNYPLDGPPVNLADRDYVQAVLRTQQPYFGNAILGRATGDPLLTVAVPVRNDRGEVLRILAGTIRIDLPEGGLATIGAQLDSAVVLDGSGQVVVDRGTVRKPTPASPAFLEAVAAASESARTDSPGPDGVGTWIAGAAPVGNSAWRAVTLLDQQAAFADSRRALLLELGALLLVALLGALLTIGTARRLNRRTTLERAEAEQVRRREAFFHELADALPVVGGTLDTGLSTTFANRTLRAARTSQLLELLHPEDAETLRTAEGDADADSTFGLDIRLATGPRGADYRWHRLNLVPAPQLPGARWFFAATDIEDEKRAELGLQRDIQQRDEFLGLVSHELRNPLAAIIGNASMLTGRYAAELPKDAYESAEEIDLSARRLRRLVENMLVLSQAGNPESPPPIEPQLVPRLLGATQADFHARYPAHSLRLHLDPDLPVVLANETFVDQILWNLLTNAAKYGGETRIIDLTARRAGDAVEVSVADRGPGLAPDELDRVFDAHFRSRTARAQAEGLGLGLSVCRRLVEAQGGVIEARPTPGGGTTVSFTLPIAED
ncbi:MAG: sensor histidine kinase [Dehalococcoidia bacterium]